MLTIAAAARADDDDDRGSTNRVRRPIEELFKTDVVFPEEKGEFEVELASIFQNHSGVNTWTLPISAEYGVTDRLQFEAEWNSIIQHYRRNQSTMRGLGDVEMGAQYSFLNIDGSNFHIAPRFSLNVPTGNVNRDMSDGFLEYEPAIVLARDVPQWHKTQFFTELGSGWVQRINRPKDSDDAEPSAHELDWNAGAFVLFNHCAATLEYNLANSTWNHHGTENEMYITPGFLYRPIGHLEIGLGIPVGLNNHSDNFEIISHIVWEF